MIDHPDRSRRAGAAGLAASLFIALTVGIAGCTTGSGQRAGTSSTAIVLDGDASEWPHAASVTADSGFVYFRFGVEDELTTIQHTASPVSLWLDADANASTGKRMTRPAGAGRMGVDVEITFSPLEPADGRAPGRGAVVRLYGDDGEPVALLPAQADLVYAPTHAAERFEARVSRHLADVVDSPGARAAAERLAKGGPARAMYVLLDESGDVAGWSDPESTVFPSASATPPVADLDLPSKDEGTIRVVSYNVFRGAPMSNPGPFGRLFQTLNPDIVLFQEWDAKNAAMYEAWFTAVVPSAQPWRAVAGPGGVGIVSRHPVRVLSSAVIEAPEGERPPRFVPGVVRTPLGEIVVGSVHLKCCGYAGSPEDVRRVEEAGAINAALRTALGSEAPAARVLAGDLNLVGSRSPLDALAEGLAPDGGDLTIVRPLVLGDGAGYTWFDPGSEFPPGRLDYALVGGGEVVRAFILDTARLSERALASIGLDRPDTGASDHRPLVVDLRLK